MKLLLTSGGIMNDSISDALLDLTGKPFNQLKLAFIPTAANLEEGDKWWFIKDLNTCKELGFEATDIVDISALPQKIWKDRLEVADVIWVEGGNTFHLMYWINNSGLTESLPRLLENRVYVGVSAGSIVATPSLVLSSAEKGVVIEIGEEVHTNGLSLVPFLIEPHINSSYFPELTFENLKKQAKTLPYAVYGLDDQSAIKVSDQDIEIISEGKWQKFEKS